MVKSRAAGVALLLLGGCAHFDTPIESKANIRDVVDRLQCEFKDAYTSQIKEGHDWLANYAASYLLTLRREEILEGSPHIGYEAPINSTDTFSLGNGGHLGVTNTKIRVISTKRQFLLKDLASIDCTNLKRNGEMFRGKLGIAEGLDEALSAEGTRRKNNPFRNSLVDLGYTITFELKKSASIDPTFGFVRVTGLGIDIGGSTDRTDTVDIAYSDATPAKQPPPLEVHVTNFPVQGLPSRPQPPSEQKPGRPRKAEGAPTSLPVITPDVEQRLNNTLNRLHDDTFRNRLQR
jgi:hypothetical protein